MGFMSRKVVPACGKVCMCCPALRSRSRQPVKRYKKLLLQIYNTGTGRIDDRKIGKLCEYAAKNPFRIPKIAHFLHQKLIFSTNTNLDISIHALNKLLTACRHHMLYLAPAVLHVIRHLLEQDQEEHLRILGCQTLTTFISSQDDAAYAHTIDLLLHTLLLCASLPPASTLHCVSSMLCFMARFSYTSTAIQHMLNLTLDNYQHCVDVDVDHHWLQEVVQTESTNLITPPPLLKDPSLFTRDEMETPSLWAQICIQRLSHLLKDNTTMRQVLDPIFIYFDTRSLWVPTHGLPILVLSHIFYFIQGTGREQSILSAIIRHLDHKNVAHDHRVKADIIQIVAALVNQFRSKVIPVEAGIVEDLCRHLRRSLQVTVALTGEQDISLNIALHNSIEECILQLTKEVGGTQPLFDVIIFALENHTHVGLSARATTVFMLTLGRIISTASACAPSPKVFPEALLFQLLKTMVHPDAETRILAHQIFSALLVPTYNCPRHELIPFKPDHTYESKSLRSKSVPVYASAASLLEKLRREKEGHVNAKCDLMEKEPIGEDWKHGWDKKRSVNLSTISSTIDKTVPAGGEVDIIKLSEDQIAQMLSSLWNQACLPDNLPSNFEAISRSFNLILVSSYPPRNADGNLVRFFQLPLSLRSVSVDVITLTDRLRRSLFVLGTAMLMSAARMYQIPHLSEILESSPCYDVSETDDETVVSQHTEESIRDVLVGSLSSLTKLDEDKLRKKLSEAFRPDDSFTFVPQSWHSLSFDGDVETSDSGEGELPKTTSHVLSVGQLLESALEKAGEMAGTAVSTTPQGFSTMAWQCEALGSKKLGNWLDDPTQAEGGWSTMRLPPASPFDNFLRGVTTC